MGKLTSISNRDSKGLNHGLTRFKVSDWWLETTSIHGKLNGLCTWYGFKDEEIYHRCFYVGTLLEGEYIERGEVKLVL